MIKKLLRKISEGILICSLLSNYKAFSQQIKIKISDLVNYNKPIREILNRRDSIWLAISKEDHIAYFIQGDRIIKSYPIAMSSNYKNDKEREGDRGVPEGLYYITSKASGKIFYKFSPINYPNEEDAREALKKGIINEKECSLIIRANRRKNSFIPHTRAGSAIGLHGSTIKNDTCLGVGKLVGDTFIISDWTLGCIAFNNFDWKEILEYIEVWRTPIYIAKKINPEDIKNLKNIVWQRKKGK